MFSFFHYLLKRVCVCFVGFSGLDIVDDASWQGEAAFRETRSVKDFLSLLLLWKCRRGDNNILQIITE